MISISVKTIIVCFSSFFPLAFPTCSCITMLKLTKSLLLENIFMLYWVFPNESQGKHWIYLCSSIHICTFVFIHARGFKLISILRLLNFFLTRNFDNRVIKAFAIKRSLVFRFYIRFMKMWKYKIYIILYN